MKGYKEAAGSDSAASQGEGLDLNHMGLRKLVQAVRGPPFPQGAGGSGLGWQTPADPFCLCGGGARLSTGRSQL